MLGFRKLINKPKHTDTDPLAVFYHCDIAVTRLMKDLNRLMENFPDNLDRRATLIRQLKEAQHNLVNVLMVIVEDALGSNGRASREFRAKYPDDVALDQVNGPIWFGAECIAAGSHIANHEAESVELRPYAINLSKYMSQVREALREQCFIDRLSYSQKVKVILRQFDIMWVNFELRYVSLMCNVMTEEQYYYQQDTIVLFSEATIRAMQKKYITCEMVEMLDPIIMFAIPRLAIICGLIVYPDGPLDLSKPKKDMPPFFRGYRQLLTRIKELLGHLTPDQLTVLEQALCSAEGISTLTRKKLSKSPLRSMVSSRDSGLLRDQEERNIHSLENKSIHEMDISEHNSCSLPNAEQPEQLQDDPTLCSAAMLPDKRKISTGSMDLRNSCVVEGGGRATRRSRVGPAGFASAEDLMHRLFVAISGVADQLQTNHAKDLRVILKHVFAICQSGPSETFSESTRHSLSAHYSSDHESVSSASADAFRIPMVTMPATDGHPSWVADPCCSTCHERFSWAKRRHHCRNCGNVTCAKCCSSSMPLPKLGITRPVRVCTNCYIQLLGEAVQRTNQVTQPSQLLWSYS